MYKNNIFIFLSFYLIYMFIFFKTTISFNHPYELNIISLNNYLKHSFKSSKYESKICLFGKYAIFFLVAFLITRKFYNFPKFYSKFILLITFVLSLMNMNAVLYLLPYFIIELYLLNK